MHVLGVDVVLVDELLLIVFLGLVVRLHHARSNVWLEGISF